MDTAIVCMEAVCALRDYMAASATCVSTNLTSSHYACCPLHNDDNDDDNVTITNNEILICILIHILIHHLHGFNALQQCKILRNS